MRITSKKLYFIISEEESGPRKPFVWCELATDFYFKEYNVAGVNDVHNQIYLSLSTSNNFKNIIVSICNAFFQACYPNPYQL